jgi:hypothetical protein
VLSLALILALQVYALLMEKSVCGGHLLNRLLHREEVKIETEVIQ